MCVVKNLASLKKSPFLLIAKRYLLNPWNFPSVKRGLVIYSRPLGPHLIIYSNEVTQGGERMTRD